MLTLLIALAFLRPGQEHTRPSDFAFRLEYGVCTTDVLDTFQGTFVRDLSAMVPAVSIPLALPEESLDEAYRAIVAAGFFKYPPDFRTSPKTACTRTPIADGVGAVSCFGITGFAPAHHYRLTVREAGVTHTVSWHDNTAPSTEEADRLRHMLNVIVEMIRALPQVRRLPLAQVGCA
jgi:hypothetical protein